jgi:hypothetical protein
MQRTTTLALVGLLVAGGCGGSTSGTEAERPEGGGSRKTAQGDTAGETDESGGGSEPSAPRRPACEDETCFECGGGICMTGFYCDEGAQGGAACSWLPDCAGRASCACVKRALGSGCDCQERGGGVHVKCSN